MSKLQDELRRKGQLPVGDKLMLYMGEWQTLQPGDQYLAHTEGEEPDILTCRRREVQKRRRGDVVGKIFPKERKKKLYDLHEVVRVMFIDNPNVEKETPPNERIDHGDGRVDIVRPESEGVAGAAPDTTGAGELAARGDAGDAGEPAVPGKLAGNRPVPRPPGRPDGKPRTDYSSAGKRADAAARRRAPDGDPGER